MLWVVRNGLIPGACLGIRRRVTWRYKLVHVDSWTTVSLHLTLLTEPPPQCLLIQLMKNTGNPFSTLTVVSTLSELPTAVHNPVTSFVRTTEHSSSLILLLVVCISVRVSNRFVSSTPCLFVVAYIVFCPHVNIAYRTRRV